MYDRWHIVQSEFAGQWDHLVSLGDQHAVGLGPCRKSLLCVDIHFHRGLGLLPAPFNNFSPAGGPQDILCHHNMCLWHHHNVHSRHYYLEADDCTKSPPWYFHEWCLSWTE